MATKALPTFRIHNDETFEEFAAIVGIELKGKGALPMVAIFRAAADQGRAFTIDGYKPSEASVSPTSYTIQYKTPAKVDGAEMVLSVDKVRELAGIEKVRGRIPLDTFKAAVANVEQLATPEWVLLTSVKGDLPDSPDLCIPQKRTRKPKENGEANAENAEQNGDSASE